MNLPFVFAVINKDGKIVYQNGDIPPVSDVIQQVLFPNDPPSKQNYLKVYFPTKGDYISSSVTFIVPSIIFSLDTFGNVYLYHLYRVPSEATFGNEE